ncbi:DUF6044 family protein [Echinicola jeungdonensis]|uniref:DUF6044 family protein n=1 Tax=Echinicola jeungdonensis TaxID=709343 RepID=UPI0025B2C8F4|nr:DUF6044 family protein [Echinicola jeungdonensis]MDN3667891.1 DUF6044 family protein [Echinicola jeungdonensis]
MEINNRFQTNFWLPYFLIGLLALIIFYSPYFILGKDSVWYANDYLELVVPWYKTLIDQNAILKPNDFVVKGMLNELPRGVFASEWFLKTWFFYFLEPFQAILFNKILIQIIAFCSAFHFSWFWKKSWRGWPVMVFSLLWATLPFWPEGGIGTAFYPTVFFVFYQLSKGKLLTIKYMALIGFYVIYSQLHLHGLFVGIAVFLVGIGFWIRKKKTNPHYWYGLFLLTLLFTATNYRLFEIYFFARDWFIPHRAEYEIHSFAYFHQDFWGVFLNHLSKGILHGTYFSPFLIVVAGGGLFGVLSKKLYHKNQLPEEDKLLVKLLIGCLLIAGAASFLKYTPFLDSFELLKKLNQFSYDRFSLFIAPLLMMSLALVLQKIYCYKRWIFWV